MIKVTYVHGSRICPFPACFVCPCLFCFVCLLLFINPKLHRCHCVIRYPIRIGRRASLHMSNLLANFVKKRMNKARNSHAICQKVFSCWPIDHVRKILKKGQLYHIWVIRPVKRVEICATCSLHHLTNAWHIYIYIYNICLVRYLFLSLPVPLCQSLSLSLWVSKSLPTVFL